MLDRQTETRKLGDKLLWHIVKLSSHMVALGIESDSAELWPQAWMTMGVILVYQRKKLI